MVRNLILVAAAAAMGACTFPEEPLPPGDARVVVHAILDPSRSIQVVALMATDASPLKPADLDSAIIILGLPDGSTLRAKQDSEPPDPYEGYYSPVAASYRFDLQAAGIQLVPGQQYDLQITTRAGDVITGSTLIPAASPSAAPGAATSFNRIRDTLRLSWDAVGNARAYELQVWRTFTQYYGGRDLTYSRFVSDSVRLAGTARAEDDDVFLQGSQATVYLFAVDENYYEYYRAVGDPYVGAAPSRLQGALGVFGSVVPIARRELTVH